MKKRHHTVPKCYLENFTDDEGFVWILDTKDNIFCIKPANILLENHFYSITLKNGEKSLIVEDMLADIEGAYISVFLNKIKKELPLIDEDRATIAVFIAALFLRTKPHREGLRGMFKNLQNTITDWQKQFALMSDESKKAMEAIHSSEDGETISVEDVDEYVENLNDHHSINTIDQLPHIAQIIFNMKWTIWKDPNGNFVTSDDPVVILRPEAIKKYGADAIGSRPGLLFKDVELTVPLSKNMVLLATWEMDQSQYSIISQELVKAINHRTITHSSERVVNKSEESAKAVKSRYSQTAYNQKKRNE